MQNTTILDVEFMSNEKVITSAVHPLIIYSKYIFYKKQKGGNPCHLHYISPVHLFCALQ